MTGMKDLSALRRAGSATPARMSRVDVLLFAAQLYGGKSEEDLDFGASYNTIRDIEHRPQHELDQLKTRGNAFDPLVQGLRNRGQSIPETIGGLMRLGMSREDIHHIACYCNHGREVSGQALSQRFIARAQVGPDDILSSI